MSNLTSVETWLRQDLSGVLGRALSDRDSAARFKDLGLDSAAVTGVISRLSRASGRPLSIATAWAHPTIQALAAHVTTVRPPANAPARVHEPASAVAAVAEPEPIAVIGIGCSFPGARGPEAYWQLLREGRASIREVPPARWNLASHYADDPNAPGKMSTRWGAFLDDVDRFDPGFFGMSPREAASVDPQQRLALELVWEALEDAGVAPGKLRGQPVGVFFGAMWSDYGHLAWSDAAHIDAHSAPGQDLSLIAGRVSYVLGLEGPSLLINTACSSSLVALHQACHGLRAGEARLALVGGINLILSPLSTVAMSKFGAMAPDGRCKAFDAAANGYVRGEGGGVVVLKPLSQALRDGDRVYCAILGSAVNNDGASNGLTAPNPLAQQSVIEQACLRAGVDARRVDYVETHGPGTRVGDPIEAMALGAAYGAGRPPEEPLLIGSVKTNLGHLEAAAGMAGLLKVALALRHRELPPSLNFVTPNPDIPFDEWRLKVVTDLRPWPGLNQPPLAGVSSFGFGGTNAHVTLAAAADARTRILPVAGATGAQLRLRLAELLEILSAEGSSSAPVDDICRESAAVLAEGPVRTTVVADSEPELREALGRRLQDRSRAAAAGRPDVVLVCPGQGSNPWGVGRELMQAEPSFRAALAACNEVIAPLAGFSVLDALLASEGRARLERTDVAQPVEFALQVALGAVWRSWGVAARAVIGHSMGEVAAAHLAGVLSLEDAARVICVRSRLAQTLSGQGALAVVGASREEVRAQLHGEAAAVAIAADNGPRSLVLSGDPDALEAVLQPLEQQGHYVGRTDIRFAAHSAQVDPLLPRLREELGSIRPRTAEIPLISTVTGDELSGRECGAAYWARNLRETVQFAGAIRRELDRDRPLVFLELSAHPLLHRAIGAAAAGRAQPVTLLASLHRDRGERSSMLQSLATLYEQGETVDWPAVVGPRPARRRLEHLASDSAPPATPAPAELFVVSAPSEAGLRELARGTAAALRAGQAGSAPPLRDLCFSSARARADRRHRLAVVRTSCAELADALDGLAAGQAVAGAATGTRQGEPTGGLAFVCPAETSHWRGMGRGLYRAEPAFRDAIRDCAEAFAPHLGRPLLDLMNGESAPGHDAHQSAAAAMFAVQVALAAQWRAWGVVPDAIIGDGLGEVAAAHIAGQLSLRDAAQTICQPTGARAAIGCTDGRNSSGSIAVYAPAVGGLAQMIRDGHRSFVELGQTASLLGTVDEAASGEPARVQVLASLRPDEDERATLLQALGRLYVSGQGVRWAGLFREGARLVSLPGHAWVRERHWLPVSREVTPSLRQAGAAHPLLDPPIDSALHPGLLIHQQSLELQRQPFLRDHKVRDATVLPAAAQVEMLWAAAAGQRLEHELTDLSFTEAVVFEQDECASLQLTVAPEGGGRNSLRLSRRRPGEATWRQVAAGVAAPLPGEGAASRPAPSRSAFEQSCERQLEAADVYALLAEHGLAYGPAFQSIQRLWLRGDEAAALIRPADAAFALDPTTLDAAFQVLCALCCSRRPVDGPLVPVALARYRLRRRPHGALWCHATMTSDGATPGSTGALAGDLALFDAAGLLVADIDGLRFEAIEQQRPGNAIPLHRLEWLERALPARTAPADGRWLVLGRGPEAHAIATALRSRGAEAALASPHAPPGSPEAWRALWPGSPDGPAQVVYLGALEAAADGSPDDPARATEEIALGVLSLVKALGWDETGAFVSRVVLVTRGAQPVTTLGLAGLAQSSLIGAGRTLANEQPLWRCKLVDLDEESLDAAALADELVVGDDEQEVAWRGGRRLVGRLARTELERAWPPVEDPASGRALRAQTDASGRIEATHFECVRLGQPGPGEVLIDVQAAALNFIDVMKALGSYPGAPAGSMSIGLECAGRVAALGEQVSHLVVGQPVMAAMVAAGLASQVLAPADRVLPIPAGLSPAQASSVLVAFATAWHALVDLARVQPGERVLVHAASGGTGLAAVQVARRLGATVMATAGSETKRRYLRELGIEHVFDSRSLAFEREIRAATAGQGVDVVVNSLAGAAADASLRLLAEDGRFIELGKTDIYKDRPLGSGSFRRRLGYFAVDLVGWAQQRPERLQALLRRIADELAAGLLQPLPVRIFAASALPEAVTTLARAEHVGKIVLDLERAPPTAVRTPSALLREDGAYLVTGGLGGLGLRLARWLADNGARRLVLLGRKPPSPDASRELASLRASGAQVWTLEADVSDRDDLGRALSAATAQAGPLRGVFHLAMVLEDGLLGNQTAAAFIRVLAPKVAGAWNLHELTAGTELDHFVLYSSVAATLGLPGQGTYAAANAFLDGLAHHRRAQGLPATSIAWGPYARVGQAAASELRGERLARQGLGPLEPARAEQMLQRLLCRRVDHVMAADFDFAAWSASVPHAARAARFQPLALRSPAPAATPTALRQALDESAGGAPREGLQTFVLDQAAAVLRLDPERIDRTASLQSLGLDSLMSLELCNRLAAGLSMPISATVLWTYPSIKALVEFLGGRLREPASPHAEPALAAGEPADEIEAIKSALASLEAAER